MSDQHIETRLDALFGDTEAFPDAAEFAARTQRRLRHGRRMRWLMLALIGTAASSLSAYLLSASGVLVDLAKVLDAVLRATGGFGLYWAAAAALAALIVDPVNKAIRGIDA